MSAASEGAFRRRRPSGRPGADGEVVASLSRLAPTGAEGGTVSERTDVTWGAHMADFWLVDGHVTLHVQVIDCNRGETPPDAARVLCERLADLLTADDERIEREGHRTRCLAEGMTPSSGAVSDAAWVTWSHAALLVPPQSPVAALDTLEAAYRAAVDQG